MEGIYHRRQTPEGDDSHDRLMRLYQGNAVRLAPRFLAGLSEPSPALGPVCGSVHGNMLQYFSGNKLFELDSRHGVVRALGYG